LPNGEHHLSECPIIAGAKGFAIEGAAAAKGKHGCRKQLPDDVWPV